jgi:subtilisin family serine protease
MKRILQICTITLLSLSASAFAEGKRYAILLHSQNSIPAAVETAIQDAGGTITSRVPQIGTLGVQSNNPDFVALMQKSRHVQAITEDIEYQLIPAVEPGDPTAEAATEPPGPDPQPGTDNLYNQQWDKMRMNASATGSYAVQQGRKDVVVAILDTGAEVLPNPHPDIAPNLDFARSRSFVVPLATDAFPPPPPGGDPNPARWDDRNGHGSWCASAVGAPINTVGISGVAPNVTLVALKVLRDTGSGSFLWLAEALVYAGLNKFDVASMSLGGYIPHSDGGQTLIKIVQRAVNFARENGVTPIAALGNDNFNLSDGRFMGNFLETPGELDGVIGVSATTYDNRKAFYSNYGVGKTDISAPGGGSTTFNPQPPTYFGNGRVVGAYASEAIGTVAPANRYEECNPAETICNYYAWIRGTSMACPNAAGVAALIISQYGDFTLDNSNKLHMSPQAVEARLQKTANNQPCVDNDFADSFALDAECDGDAGYNSFFGKGIVDAFKAVTDK